MSAELPPRPRQLMLAAGVVIGGSAILVAAVLDALGNLQSVDTRQQLTDAVASTAGKDFGITVPQALDALRVTLSVTGACAAIAFVLGIFVLQRHRSARVVLSVVAVPLLLTAPVVGGFLGAFVAVATLMLWTGPAGDWYAGRPVRQPAAPRGGRGPDRASGTRPTPPVPPPVPRAVPPAVPPAGQTAGPTAGPPGAPTGEPHGAPSTRATSTAPGATEGFGNATPDPASPPVPGAPAVPTPWGGQPQVQLPAPTVSGPVSGPVAGPVSGPVAGPMPVPVRIACVLTWVFAGSVALVYLAGVVALLVDRAAIVDRVVASAAWKQSGVGQDALVPLLWFGVLLFLAWSLGAVVLAWFTWRRHDWARYLLAVSAGLALAVGAVAFPVGLLHQLACATTIGTLFSPRARLWFARRQPPPAPPQGPPPPPPARGGPW